MVIYLSRADESPQNTEDLLRLERLFKDFAPQDCVIQLQLFPEENHASTAIVSTSQALMKIFKN